MNCQNCGARLTADEKFCANCGAPVAAEPSRPATLPLLGLYITSGPGVGRSMQLGETTRIGRGAENEFRLYDPEVSREHAAVYRYDQGFAVNDVGSANGTFLNGKRVMATAWIEPGDTIRVGNVQTQDGEPAHPPVTEGAESRRLPLPRCNFRPAGPGMEPQL